MGNFHRFVDPTYFLFGAESFPAAPGGTGVIGPHVYDRINVVSGGTGGGGAANADGQKAAGVTQYTYFVAFGEDGTSQNANRGFRALAENCDVLDDLFRTSTPRPSSQSVAGASQTSVVLTGDIFVGDLGTSISEVVALLVQDTTLSTPYNGGVAISITDLDDGTPGSSVLGGGFYTNPTARLSGPLPVGSNYSFIFFTRTSTARLIETERQKIVSLSVSALRTSVSNSRMLAYGFDEVYRRSLAKPDVFTNDSPGDGATVQRDGKAMTFIPSPQDWTSVRYHDPYLANVVGELAGVANQTTIQRAYSGDMNNVHVGMWRVTETNAGEETTYNRPLASYAALNIRNPTGATFGGVPTYTYIPKDSPAVLNDTGIGADTVTVAGGLYFRNGSSDTAMLTGYDLLLITRQSGDVEAYVVSSFQTATRVAVRTLGGELPTFPTTENVTITWAQPLFTAGGGMSDFAGNDPKWGPLTVIWPSLLSSNTAVYDAPLPPVRLAGPALPSPLTVLAIGEVDPTSGTIDDILRFTTDGQVIGRLYSRDLKTRMERASRYVYTVSGVQTFQWNPATHGSYVIFRFTANDSELTIELSGSYTPEDGDKFIFEFEGTATTKGCVVTWNSVFYDVSTYVAVINYTSGVRQVVRGQYNDNASRFVSFMDSAERMSLWARARTMREVKEHFLPPYATASNDHLESLFVGQADLSFYVASRNGDAIYYSHRGDGPWNASDMTGVSIILNNRVMRSIAADGATVMLCNSISASATAGFLIYSTDRGVSWNDGPALPSSASGLKKLAYGNSLFWGLTNGGSVATPPTTQVFYGAYNAATWTAATGVTGYLWDMAYDGSTRVIFVGETVGGDGVIYSNATAPALTLEQTCVGEPLRAIAREPFSGRWVALGSSGGYIWVSDDGGGTWTRHTTAGLAGVSVRGLVALESVLVCTYTTVGWTDAAGEYVYLLAISGDLGRTWHTLGATFIGTASSSFDSGEELVTLLAEGTNERFIVNFGDLKTAAVGDTPAVSSWKSGILA